MPPKATWDTIASFSGCNSGIGGGGGGGFLLIPNTKVYITCRSIAKAEATIAALENETGRRTIILPLDLSSFDSIKQAAAEFRRQESVLHILFNNAGVMAAPMSLLTHEHYDLQFGVNVLGTMMLLYPRVQVFAEPEPRTRVRFSLLARSPPFLRFANFEALTDTPTRSKMSPDALYAQSKFSLYSLNKHRVSFECARRHASDGVISIALHPGMLTTDIGRHFHPSNFSQAKLNTLSLTRLWADTAPKAATLNGKVHASRTGTLHQGTLDPAFGAQL
ncbi:NAD(P)-binding protein [Mycena rebaudengoi]|nr:NAD(P)-binding protein [Mycena rebaudengoi]